jgi:hypothetical protein
MPADCLFERSAKGVSGKHSPQLGLLACGMMSSPKLGKGFIHLIAPNLFIDRLFASAADFRQIGGNGLNGELPDMI